MGEGPKSNLKELKGDKIKEVLANTENKFIYYYRKSIVNPEEFQRVNEFA